MGSPLQKLTLGAYLAWENAQVERDKFDKGTVLPMASAGCEVAMADVFDGIEPA